MVADRRRIHIVNLLTWAFATQCADLDLPDLTDPEERGQGFGLEWVLIQRARLGNVQIDNSPGKSRTNDDADHIAAVVSQIPDALGGRGMAIWISQLARLGRAPGWARGEVPKIMPIGWKRENQFGREAKTERAGVYVETFHVPHPRNPTKTIPRKRNHEIRYCPCTWAPSLQEIQGARRDYMYWWSAVDHVRFELMGHSFKEFSLSATMPPKAPWSTVEAIRAGGSPGRAIR